MKTFLTTHLVKKLAVLSLLLVMGTWVTIVSATTPTTPTIDGNITTDWDSNENLGPAGPNASGPNLWVTWDANNLYIGIEADPDLAIQMFFDVEPGGASRDTNDNYNISGNDGGYQYAWRVPQGANHTPPNERWFTYNEGDPNAGWGSGLVANTTNIGAGYNSAYGDDLEIAIPWTALGFTQPPAADSRLGLLVTIGPNLAGGAVTYYWPDTSGNSNDPVSFTQQFIFDDAGAAGVVTGNSPTAVSLANIFTSSSHLTGFGWAAGLLTVLTLIVVGLWLRPAAHRPTS